MIHSPYQTVLDLEQSHVLRLCTVITEHPDGFVPLNTRPLKKFTTIVTEMSDPRLTRLLLIWVPSMYQYFITRKFG